MYIQRDQKGVLYYELLLENQVTNSNNYCSQLKTAPNEKYPELFNRKCIIFHQDNARTHVYLMTRQKLLQLDWEVLIRLPYSPDVVPLMPTNFSLYRILLMEKISMPQKTVKGTWNSSLVKKIKSFWKMKLWNYLKSGKSSGTKQ